MKYLRLSPDDYVIGSGECQPEVFKTLSATGEGRVVEYTGALPDPLQKTKLANGKLVVQGSQIPLIWEDHRRIGYPPVHEQLEALMEGGQELAELKQRIAAVKVKFPKPV